MDGVYHLQFDPNEDRKLYSHSSYVSSTAWLKNNQVISTGYDGKIKFFDFETEKTKQESQLHSFWSWDMCVSPDEKLLASVTGQYLAGGYKYEPKPETEPSIKVLSAESGEVLHSLPHVPSVQAVAFSPDNQFVAAGNLMGEVRVFDVNSGKLVSSWTTPDFTSWGIIKSHCYLGGIFAMTFTPDGKELLLAGMGKMRDPMAGNGRQLWQKWKWQDSKPSKTNEIHKEDSGEGLMETLAIHPSGKFFTMAGRLRGGDWNIALFELQSGKKITSLNTKCRVTQACYNADGSQLILVGAQGQPKTKKDGEFPRFGRVEIYNLKIIA
ncbi:MAG: hypothetical protein COA78_11170 [Blastopirellula sp.]|nr:MAG: hypothetical protein COA78_11170 [Blastopirellula sp.]